MFRGFSISKSLYKYYGTQIMKKNIWIRLVVALSSLPLTPMAGGSISVFVVILIPL